MIESTAFADSLPVQKLRPDIALRDFGLPLGALALARLTHEFGGVLRPRA
jgi:hypothetical protein